MGPSGRYPAVASAAVALLALAGCGALDITSINQKGTPRGEVLNDHYADTMQKLADSQDGSTVHRYPNAFVVEARAQLSTGYFPGLVKQNIVIPEAARQTRAQHAPTIAEVAEGVWVAAWFGGTWERMGDVGIWSARYEDGQWGEATQIVAPEYDETYDEWKAPCWNPVLLHLGYPLYQTILFYQVGLDTHIWEGYIKRSYDGGKTWSEGLKMEGDGIQGPTKNPPLVLNDGTILSGSSDENDGFTSHVEVSWNNGWSWTKRKDMKFKKGIIQPSLFQTSDGIVRATFRSKDGNVAQTVGYDKFQTVLPVSNTNVKAPWAAQCAIALKDGRVLMVHNTEEGRGELAISLSYNSGDSYKRVAFLEQNTRKYPRKDECAQQDEDDDDDSVPGDGPEYSYPTCVQSRFDDMVHVVYTYSYYGSGGRCTGRENVKHVIVDPALLGVV